MGLTGIDWSPASQQITEPKFLIAMVEETLHDLVRGRLLEDCQRGIDHAFLDVRLRLKFREKCYRRLERAIGLNDFNIRDGGLGRCRRRKPVDVGIRPDQLT